MGKLLWTNTRDDPTFSPYKYMILVPAFFFIILGPSIGVVRNPRVSMFALLATYMVLCIFVGIFILHSHIFNLREFLIVWEDKVFVQIPGFNSGWRTIPRDKFKVDAFRYDAKDDLNAPANAPEIVLERPYKGKIYFLFKSSLVSPKLGGITRHLVLERDIHELIEILKPKRVLRTVFALTGGYAYAKANLGDKLGELINKVLDVNITPIAIGLYGVTNRAGRVAASVDDTLLALSLFKREREAGLFIEYCITGKIERYMRRLRVLKIGDMWHPNTGKFSDYWGNILWIPVISSLLIMIISMAYGSHIFTAATILTISVGAAAVRGSFVSYNGIMGDTRLRYYLGMIAGLTVDVLFGIVHLMLPFIAVMLAGPAAALPGFILYAYIVHSVAFSVLSVTVNIFHTGYIEYRKLAKEWHKFLKEEENRETDENKECFQVEC